MKIFKILLNFKSGKTKGFTIESKEAENMNEEEIKNAKEDIIGLLRKASDVSIRDFNFKPSELESFEIIKI